MLVADLDPDDRAQLASALRLLRQALRQQYRTLTPALARVERQCASRARARPDATITAATGAPPQHGHMLLLLDYAEVSQALGVSRRSVQRLVEAGDLPVVTIGTVRRVHRDDLEAFVEARRRPSAPQPVPVPTSSRSVA